MEATCKTYFKHDYLLWVLFFALMLMISCSEGSVPSKLETKASSSEYVFPALYLMGIDASGSYAYKDEAISVVEIVLSAALPGSLISIRIISEDSYLAKNGILTAKTPSFLRVDRPNPFKQNREKAAQLKAKQDKWKQELLNQVASGLHHSALKTDLPGFLLICSERIKDRKPKKAYIVILSDLESNVNKHSKFLQNDSLEGADILVALYDHKKPETKICWTQNFMNWGASRVCFLAPDETPLLLASLKRAWEE